MNKTDFQHHVMTPQARECYPQQVKDIWGNVSGAENLLSAGTETTILRYDGDIAPKIILDLGEASTGGYPVFKVKSFGGAPVLRLAYSDWYDYIVDAQYGEIGDFRRGCCKYLGVELPVLPGDPNRFNLFTISHSGLYLSPLIQGQQRWLMIKLETPGSFVELEYVYIHYTSNMAAHDGFFECSDKALTKLWYASTWTCQIATLENSQSWDTLCGTLLLRALTKGNDAGIYKDGTTLTDYTVAFDGAIAYNPHMGSGIGLLLRAKDITGGYAVFFNLDGTVQAYKRKNSVYTLLAQASVDFKVLDNYFYAIEATAQGSNFTVKIDGKTVLTFTDAEYAAGTFGFCQTTEKWALAKNLTVTDSRGILWQDDFCHGLDAYEFTRSAPFVSDGAKRDRLPWIGDLDWAGRNIYYAFKDFAAMPEAMRMFAFHQTPEGYIWGTCYPENTKKPAIGEYGYYESDIFSAWIIPTLADYLLFTGDTAFAEEIYPNIKADADYLWRFVEADGLFNQRYATSKGLWDHVLNDIGKFTYNNLIVSDGFSEAAFIAEKLGKKDDAAEFIRRRDIMHRAIKKAFWNEEKGWLTKSLTDRDMCEMANSLALSIAFFESRTDAKRALDALLDRTPGHGKITALMIRGAYMYDFDEEAIRTLIQPGYRYVENKDDFIVYDALENPNFDFASHRMHPANWLKALNDWRGPHTTWECMTYPPQKDSHGGAWGDRSHPDTAVAHILSGYTLGVLPEEIGFQSFTVKPHTSGLSYAKGIVPTVCGDIEFQWEKHDDNMTVALAFSGSNILTGIWLNKNDAREFTVTCNKKRFFACGEVDGYILFK